MRLRAILATGSLILVGCSSGGGGGVASCDDLFADGAVLSAEDFEAPCSDDGDVTLQAWLLWDCPSGAELRSNDYGWGVVGEPFHAGAEPSLDDIESC